RGNRQTRRNRLGFPGLPAVHARRGGITTGRTVGRGYGGADGRADDRFHRGGGTRLRVPHPREHRFRGRHSGNTEGSGSRTSCLTEPFPLDPAPCRAAGHVPAFGICAVPAIMRTVPYGRKNSADRAPDRRTTGGPQRSAGVSRGTAERTIRPGRVSSAEGTRWTGRPGHPRVWT